ncbi:YncE family protein [Fontibacter flavus]|uniref:YncE family protein n=1 Tax=Fontibacter flavus TaxID=654838 RepID=A0ABV6FR01_9BACT
MRKLHKLCLAVFMLMAFFSCKEEENQIPLGEFENGVFIINEGAFGANDGEVYHYDPSNGQLKSNIFESKNARPFAGLLQDMVEVEGRLYLVANTGKVEVVDPKDFASKGAVSEGLDISRSLVVANQKLYISDWGPYDANFNSPDSYIAVVDQLDGGTVSKKISVSSNPEGMFLAGNQILVACESAQKMDVISVSTEAVTKSLEVIGRPVRFFESDGKLFLYAKDSENIYLHEINRSNAEILQTVEINVVLATSKFTLGENGELLVITSTGWPDYNDAIARVNINSREVLNQAIFSGSGFYGIGYHPQLKEIYVGDNNGFQGSGTVIVLDQNGQQLKTFTAGRGPSGFLVK